MASLDIVEAMSLDMVGLVMSIDVVDAMTSFGAVNARVSLGVVGVVQVSVRTEVSELRQTHQVGGAHSLDSLAAQGVGQVQQTFQVTVWGVVGFVIVNAKLVVTITSNINI